MTTKSQQKDQQLLNEIKEGNIRKAVKLLNAGANPNSSDITGWTPLHYAAYHNSSEAVILLLNHHANPNAAANNGWTPLHSAASHNYTTITNLLIQHNADPDATTTTGQTPYQLATDNNHTEMARLIKDYINIAERGKQLLRTTEKTTLA